MWDGATSRATAISRISRSTYASVKTEAVGFGGVTTASVNSQLDSAYTKTSFTDGPFKNAASRFSGEMNKLLATLAMRSIRIKRPSERDSPISPVRIHFLPSAVR